MQTQALVGKYKFGVNTRWGLGPVNTNLVPGSVNTRWRARAGKYKLGARPGKYKLGARAGKYKLVASAGKYKLVARARARDQAKVRGPGNTNTCRMTAKVAFTNNLFHF